VMGAGRVMYSSLHGTDRELIFVYLLDIIRAAVSEF